MWGSGQNIQVQFFQGTQRQGESSVLKGSEVLVVHQWVLIFREVLEATEDLVRGSQGS